MIIQGYIPGWSYAEGMTSYLKANNIRIFDFSSFSQPLTEQVRANAQRIADEHGIEIEFIRKLRAFRKDDRIQEIIEKTGKSEGLIHIFSAMEQCNTYRPWHDKTTGKTFLKFDQSKCLHYYFYFPLQIELDAGEEPYRKTVSDWLDMQIRNLDGMGGGGSGWTVGAKGACSFQTDRNPEQRMYAWWIFRSWNFTPCRNIIFHIT